MFKGRSRTCRAALPALVVALAACGDDHHGGGSGGSQAVRLGIGAECTSDAICEVGQKCLTQFKGGYCGLAGCAGSLDCPAGSACVTHSDGATYCFLVCNDKPECNVHRSLDAEANCSSSVTFVDADPGQKKACVPPSGT